MCLSLLTNVASIVGVLLPLTAYLRSLNYSVRFSRKTSMSQARFCFVSLHSPAAFPQALAAPSCRDVPGRGKPPCPCPCLCLCSALP